MRLAHLAGALIAITLAVSQPAHAAQTGDWPCIQARVPELGLAAFWSGPTIEDAAFKSWRDHPQVAKLVETITSRRIPIEEAEQRIADFAAAQKGDKSWGPLAFAGAFAELNGLRATIIAGIERFTRNQRALAAATTKDRAELQSIVASPGEKSAEQRARIQELQTKIQWETRLHAERESTLRYVCETPVLLEQRVFAIARAIQNEL